MANKPVFGSALDAYEAGSRFMDVQYVLVTFKMFEDTLDNKRVLKLPYVIQTHESSRPDVWVAVSPIANFLNLPSAARLISRYGEKAGGVTTATLPATASGRIKSRGRLQPMAFVRLEEMMLMLLQIKSQVAFHLVNNIYTTLEKQLHGRFVSPLTLVRIVERKLDSMEVRCDSLYNALMAERMGKNPQTWLNILIEERDPLVMRPLYQHHQEKGWKEATETIAPALTQLLESLTTLPLSPQQEALAEDVRQSLEQLQSKKTDEFAE